MGASDDRAANDKDGLEDVDLDPPTAIRFNADGDDVGGGGGGGRGCLPSGLLCGLPVRVRHGRNLRKRASKTMCDKHWDKEELEESIPKDLAEQIKGFSWKTEMIRMRDGTRIAADVILPPASRLEDGATIPCVFHQTRYYRQFRTRKALRLLESYPFDPINLQFKKAFTAAGFAVVSIDVRGSGASFGQWTAPCNAQEWEDSREVLDWICAKPWHNGAVYLYVEEKESAHARTHARTHARLPSLPLPSPPFPSLPFPFLSFPFFFQYSSTVGGGND